jgi:RNA polymerase sigma factor (TIGR02999 family)
MHLDDTQLTQLLARVTHGERSALDRVFAALYPELRQLARARLRTQGRIAHLDTTALVHECFLRLIGNEQVSVDGRRHFFAYAAKTMRNIIVDIAREQLAARRGGGAVQLQLDTGLAAQIGANDGAGTLIRINDALLELEALDADLAQVVEMRYFAGYSEAEIGVLLGISERTVQRRWEKARAFLLVAMKR